MKLNQGLIEALGNCLIKLSLKQIPLDTQYLPRQASPEALANYLIFMVSIDHRTGRGFKAKMEGRFYKGSDLLWKLGEIKWRKQPSFFTTTEMLKINMGEVVSWLTAPFSGKVVKKPGLRALLLRDTAKWLMKLFKGEAFKLIEAAQGSCMRLVELLRPFKAFSDPVAKKPYLLIKFLERGGLFQVEDPENLHVPVDNHLTRLALRIGLIELSRSDLETLRSGKVDLSFDVMLRMQTRSAFKRVADIAEVKPSILDDLLWLTGRTICLRQGATCVHKHKSPRKLQALVKGKWHRCPFEEVCEGLHDPAKRTLKEPEVTTWWY